MAEERLVLGRDERLDDQRRIFVIGQLDPPFAGEGLDRVAVVAADVGRQRRLVGEQVSRTSAGRSRRQTQTTAKNRKPAAAGPGGRRTHWCSNHGSIRSCTRRLKATRSGSCSRERSGARASFGELRASSGFGLARKALIGELPLTAAARGDVGFDRLRQRRDDRRAVLGRAQQRLIVGVADDSRLRTAPPALPRGEARGKRRTGAARAAARCATPTCERSTRGKLGRRAHLARSARSDEHRPDRAVGSLGRAPPRILGLGEAGRLGVRGDIGQRIDARAARQRIGRAVHVQRQEQARAKAAGDRRPAARASDIGRCRGSRRRGPGRARPAGREARGPAPGSAPFRRRSPETARRPDRARHGRDRSPRSGARRPWRRCTVTSATARRDLTVTPPRRASPISAGAGDVAGSPLRPAPSDQQHRRGERRRQRRARNCGRFRRLRHAPFKSLDLDPCITPIWLMQNYPHFVHALRCRCCGSGLRVLTRNCPSGSSGRIRAAAMQGRRPQG